MKITIFFKDPVDGMLPVNVSLYEFTDDKGKNVDIEIWVPDHDSRTEIRRSARAAAIVQLKRALAALETETSD